MIRTILLALVACILTAYIAIAWGNASLANSKAKEEMLLVELKTVAVKDGWGYEVYVDHKKVINQPFIPGIAGYHPFVNEQEARMVGNLVVERIIRGQSPGISEKDMQALHVTLPAQQQ